MDYVAQAMDWAKAHQTLVWWIFVDSIALSVLTPVVVGWAVVQLPVDYFSRKERPPLSIWERHPVLRPIYLIAKNLLGVVLVLAGIAMLVLPGQGVLTIVVGIVLLNFPGKYRLERWLATRRPVWHSLNWLRRKARRAELERPEEPLT
jgi:Putative transmembrane protein (PGPGW)